MTKRGMYLTAFPYIILIAALKNPNTINAKPTLLTPTQSEITFYMERESSRIRTVVLLQYYVCILKQKDSFKAINTHFKWHRKMVFLRVA